MIILKRLHLVSSLTASELHARLDVELGIPRWSPISILFPPAAIVMFYSVRYDLRKIEEILRKLANAPR